MLALKEYQKEGIAWLVDKPRALLSDEPGLGKTAQILLAAQIRIGDITRERLKRGILDPRALPLFCVVVPASLREVWKAEAEKWTPIFRVQLFETKKDILRDDTSLAVFSYETFRAFIEKPHRPISILAFDESHKLKDRKAKRTKPILEAASKVARVWFITGTPLPNGIADAWTCFYFITKGAVGKFWEFAQYYGYVRDTNWGRRALGCRADRMDELKEIVMPFMLRRRVSEVLPELPDYEEIVIPLTPCSEAKAILEQAESAREALRKQMDGEELTDEDKEQLISLSALRSELGHWKAKDSLDFIQNFIEQEEPVVIGVHHQSTAQALMKGLKGRLGLINTSIASNKRQQVVDSFQKGDTDALVLSIGTGSLGYTLTRSRIEILVELTYVPTELEQFQKRIRRLGQRQSCLYYFMVYPDSIDSLVYERNIQKARDIRKFYLAYEGKEQETQSDKEIQWDDGHTDGCEDFLVGKDA